MRLLPVPPEHVETTFRILRDEVASIAARSNGRFLVEDLAAAMLSGEMGDLTQPRVATKMLLGQ